MSQHLSLHTWYASVALDKKIYKKTHSTREDKSTVNHTKELKRFVCAVANSYGCCYVWHVNDYGSWQDSTNKSGTRPTETGMCSISLLDLNYKDKLDESTTEAAGSLAVGSIGQVNERSLD